MEEFDRRLNGQPRTPVVRFKMSQPSAEGESPVTAGPGLGPEEPPPLETVEAGGGLSHLAESVPLRRAAEADIMARSVSCLFLPSEEEN